MWVEILGCGIILGSILGASIISNTRQIRNFYF